MKEFIKQMTWYDWFWVVWGIGFATWVVIDAVNAFHRNDLGYAWFNVTLAVLVLLLSGFIVRIRERTRYYQLKAKELRDDWNSLIEEASKEKK